MGQRKKNKKNTQCLYTKVGEYESSETMFRMLNAYILHVDHV